MEYITGTFRKVESDTFDVVDDEHIERISPSLTEEIVSDIHEDDNKYDEKDIEFDDKDNDTDNESDISDKTDMDINIQIEYWKQIRELVKIQKDVLLDAKDELDMLNNYYNNYIPCEIFESTIYFKYFINKEVYYNNNIANSRDILVCLRQNIYYYQTLLKTGSIFTAILAGYTAIMLFVY